MPRALAPALALALLFVAVPPVAQAAPHGRCGEAGMPGIVTVNGGVTKVYVDVRGPSQGVWVYLESNGVAGLQRGGRSPVPGDVETCTDDSPNGPDMLIY